MISRRMVSSHRHHDGEGPGPSIVVVIRIALDQPGQDGWGIELQESSRTDDAMWRPPVDDAGSPCTEHDDGDDRDTTPRIDDSAIARHATSLGRPGHHQLYAEVQLTDEPPPGPLPASSRTLADGPSFADTAARLDPGTAAGIRSRRIRRGLLLAATAAAVGLVGAATVTSSPRPTSKAPAVQSMPTHIATGSTDTAAAPAVAVRDAVPTAAPTWWILLDGENGPAGTCAGTTASRPSAARSGRSEHPSAPARWVRVRRCRHLMAAALAAGINLID